MDDPFLADALEGYAVAGVNAAADIGELKKRLTEKVEGAKVIPVAKNHGEYKAPRSFNLVGAGHHYHFLVGWQGARGL